MSEEKKNRESEIEASNKRTGARLDGHIAKKRAEIEQLDAVIAQRKAECDRLDVARKTAIEAHLAEDAKMCEATAALVRERTEIESAVRRVKSELSALRKLLAAATSVVRRKSAAAEAKRAEP